MQTRYAISIKGTTRYFESMEEAVRICRFMGVPVANIKVVDLW